MTTIEPVDVADDSQYQEFYAAYRASFDRDFETPYGPREKRAQLLGSGRYFDVRAVLARDDGGLAVGSGIARFPLNDNLDMAHLSVEVVPEHRRRGHGSAVLDHLVDLAVARSRTKLLVESRWGISDEAPAGRLFVESHGFALDLLDAQRTLKLPAKLLAAPVDSAYTLQGWRGACPDELVDEYATLRGLMGQEAPNGEVGLEPQNYDAERIRFEEAGWVKQGSEAQVSVAVAADGKLAGHTQLIFPDDDPLNAHQLDTLVLPAHRGHGLGLSLKVFNQEAAADLMPGRRRISTYNADGNEHMIAVNDKLGYRPVAYLGEFVRTL